VHNVIRAGPVRQPDDHLGFRYCGRDSALVNVRSMLSSALTVRKARRLGGRDPACSTVVQSRRGCLDQLVPRRERTG
jgi:hypothetical protein